MKITKKQLKQIIKEEVETTLIKENLQTFCPQLVTSLNAVTTQDKARADVLAAFSLAFEELKDGLVTTGKTYGVDQGGQDQDSKNWQSLMSTVQEILLQLKGPTNR